MKIEVVHVPLSTNIQDILDAFQDPQEGRHRKDDRGKGRHVLDTTRDEDVVHPVAAGYTPVVDAIC